MKPFPSPIATFMIFLPGMMLAYLPVKQYIKIRPLTFIVMALLFLILILIGGILCYVFSIETIWMHLPIAVFAGFVYIHTLRITKWKSISVLLAVYGVFVCLGSIARGFDFILAPKNPTPWLSLHGTILYIVMCWISVAVSWLPATHAARELIEDDAFAETWYVFWILPLLFIALNVYTIPLHPNLMYLGRMIHGYLAISISLLFLLLLFYAMFYLIAKTLNNNHKMRQENQFLSMQQARYDNLRTAIAETREARHDMRHHFNALQNLAKAKQWDHLEKYLADIQKNIPDTELGLCENTAVDSVASHYGLLCRKQNIPCSFAMDLPRKLPIAEIDYCSILANLLENALEASQRIDPAKRQIKVQSYLHSNHMVLLKVENTFDGEIKEKDGIFQSSKRKGEGIGIQSVRRIAEKNGGFSRFTYEQGVFCAHIMLRSEM